MGDDAADSVVRGLAQALRPEGALYFNLAEGEEGRVAGAVTDLRATGYEVITLAEQEPLSPYHISDWIGGWPGGEVSPVPYRVLAPAA